MKFTQLAVASDTENGEALYAVADDGKVYMHRTAYAGRQVVKNVYDDKGRYVTDEKGNAKTEISFTPGWTEGWIEVPIQVSKPVFHANDPKRHEHE
jgi:hypothetical protein